MKDPQRFLNALAILILCAVVTGGTVLRFMYHEMPCPLCLLQRVCMICIGTAALMNLRFGIHATHYSFILFAALLGMSISLRQISLHICPQFPTFGVPFLGYSLFTWAFLVFFMAIFGTAIANLFRPNLNEQQPQAKLTKFEKFCAFYLLLITTWNLVNTFLICGFSPCQG